MLEDIKKRIKEEISRITSCREVSSDKAVEMAIDLAEFLVDEFAALDAFVDAMEREKKGGD